VGDRPARVPGVPGLFAARIDPRRETERYKASVLTGARARYTPETVTRLGDGLP
jgi:anion-transporting  ArsA/GET3 family ATPase